MDHRFLAETLVRRPRLFRAMLTFNQDVYAPVPGALSGLGHPLSDLWRREDFRRAWPVRPTEEGYWNFSEESQRIALLDAATIARLGLFFSAAVHAGEIARVIARDEVLQLRTSLGVDVVSYALKRGRYQVGGLRNVLQFPEVCGPLSMRVKEVSALSLSALRSEWPGELRRMADDRFPKAASADAVVPVLRREQRSALWFTIKKLLLREVAPEWTQCFD